MEASRLEMMATAALAQEDQRRQAEQDWSEFETAEVGLIYTADGVSGQPICCNSSYHWESSSSSLSSLSSSWESEDVGEANSSDESPLECQDHAEGGVTPEAPEKRLRPKRKLQNRYRQVSETSAEIKEACAKFLEKASDLIDDERDVPETPEWRSGEGIWGHFVRLPPSLKAISPTLGKSASLPSIQQDDDSSDGSSNGSSDDSSTTSQQMCVATSSIAYFDLRGQPCDFTQVRSAVFDYDPSPKSSRVEALEHEFKKDASRVPSLFELALRTHYSRHQTKVLDSRLEPHHGATVRRAVKMMRNTVHESGGRTRCAACLRTYVVPRTEWIEWWSGLRGAEGPVPLLRRGCSWKCLPDVEDVDPEWTDCGWKHEANVDEDHGARSPTQGDEDDGGLSPKSKRRRLS